MRNTAETVEISRLQTVFLLILALLVCVLFTWRSWEKSGSNGAASTVSLSLHVHASQLVLVSGGSAAGQPATSPTPAHLTPFFFQKVPVNRADFALLCTISGIGPQTAKEILRQREETGGLGSAEDLLAIHGIGPKKMASLQDKLEFSQ